MRGFENRKKTKNIKRDFLKNEPVLAELSNEAIDKILNYQMNLNEKNDILKKTKKKVSELEEKLENSVDRTEELDEMVVNMTIYQQHLLRKIDERMKKIRCLNPIPEYDT